MTINSVTERIKRLIDTAITINFSGSNTAATRVALSTTLCDYLDPLVDDHVIGSYFVVCDSFNNTTSIINNSIIRVNVAYTDREGFISNIGCTAKFN